MRSLPPHPDVAPALDRLREGGLTLCALTNSPLDVVDGAARARRHRRPLRGDPVRRPGAGGSSPRPSPTGSWPTRSASPIGEVRLVAAHAWDCAGALAAGAQAAFVARPGMVRSPIGEQPDIVGDDLDEVASLILA